MGYKMPEFGFDPEDFTSARDLLSRRNASLPDERTVASVANAINAERRSRTGGDVTDEELRTAHDYLCNNETRHLGDIYGVLESLASAMLARGLVPDTDAYGGEWWLGWPKKGRGPCQRCGKQRALTRYMARQVFPERYLCQRCRKEELSELEEYLNEVTSVTREPGESTDSLFLKRMTAIARQAATASHPSHRSSEPSDATWSGYAADLEELLNPLTWAGWELPESYETAYDPDGGAYLFGELFRTGMVVEVQYQPSKGELLLLPYEDEDLSRLSMLDGSVEITVSPDIGCAAELVAERAGELGLLDATRITAASGSDVSTGELISDRVLEWILNPAAEYRKMPPEVLIGQLMEDEEFSTRFKVFLDFFARNVLPDAVPDAVTLGIAAWSWRNDTDVENWHLPSDALMAKVSIAATKAIRPHVDPVEGINWQGVENSLTDTSWQLADGRVISELFADGWTDVERTVRRQVRMWRRFDENLIGPDATFRLLTIAGSTSYTRHWWGQGRWPAICRAIATDATNASVTLPAPYDKNTLEAFLDDLRDPDSLSDDVLGWMIDIPGADIDGPRGLRSHPSTHPITREFTLYLLGDVEKE